MRLSGYDVHKQKQPPFSVFHFLRVSSMARNGIPGISFSLKRALGLTALRQKAAKALKVPTTSRCLRPEAVLSE